MPIRPARRARATARSPRRPGKNRAADVRSARRGAHFTPRARPPCAVVRAGAQVVTGDWAAIRAAQTDEVFGNYFYEEVRDAGKSR